MKRIYKITPDQVSFGGCWVGIGVVGEPFSWPSASIPVEVNSGAAEQAQGS